MTNQQTELKTIMDFHGIKLPVVTHDGIDYVPLKPISDMLCLTWKVTKHTVSGKNNADLYGTKELYPPSIASLWNPRVPQLEVFIELESTIIYLARLNLNHLEANGNEVGAAYIRKLHHEWKKALYQYETTGAAFKDSAVKDLKALIDAMHKLPAGDNKQRLQRLISSTIDRMGIPNIPDPQQQLTLGA